MEDTICFGSVDYQIPASMRNTVTIGDTDDPMGTRLVWTAAGGKLIQAKSSFVGRTWQSILESGFAPGTSVSIDKMRFLCHVPILDIDQELCAEHPFRASYWAFDAVCGSARPYLFPSSDATDWASPLAVPPGDDSAHAVRLVLEPDCPDLRYLQGLAVRLLVSSAYLRAMLQTVGEYDIVCTDIQLLSGYVSPKWGIQEDGKLYIAREAVLNAGLSWD